MSAGGNATTSTLSPEWFPRGPSQKWEEEGTSTQVSQTRACAYQRSQPRYEVRPGSLVLVRMWNLTRQCRVLLGLCIVTPHSPRRISRSTTAAACHSASGALDSQYALRFAFEMPRAILPGFAATMLASSSPRLPTSPGPSQEDPWGVEQAPLHSVCQELWFR